MLERLERRIDEFRQDRLSTIHETRPLLARQGGNAQMPPSRREPAITDIRNAAPTCPPFRETIDRAALPVLYPRAGDLAVDDAQAQRERERSSPLAAPMIAAEGPPLTSAEMSPPLGTIGA